MAKRIYIAGPMTGYPNFNYEAFLETEEKLENEGWIVFNPANKDVEENLSDVSKLVGCTLTAIEHGLDMREIFLWDVSHVIKADAIYMLKGYEKSPGALAELGVAKAMQSYYPNYQIFFEP